jgi:flagellar FliJ protein
MRPFDFRLERILDLRTERAQEIASRLAEARRTAEDARHARAVIADLRASGREELERMHAEAAGSAGHMQAVSMVLDALDRHLDAADRSLREASASVEAARDEYTEALRDRRVLEKLRERKRREWRERGARRDRKVMDEAAIRRFGRDDDRRSIRPGNGR